MIKNIDVQKVFEIDNIGLVKIARSFADEMEKGLNGSGSSLRMLPSFLDVPTGAEDGNFLAIDFGGSNVRVLLLKIADRKFEIVKRTVFSLRDGLKDFTAADVDAVELFDYIAEHVKAIVEDATEQYYLGHTFSFPCKQEGVCTSYLINWTKEIKTAGVEGKDIGVLLEQALVRAGIRNIKNNVILNDTVGTLLTTAMTDDDTDIGAICGTGHNTCYREMKHPLTGLPMIVNMESGNFDKLEQSYFDKILDIKSGAPGTQKLEKMVSGHYLGEVAGIVLREMVGDDSLKISSADVSAVVANGVNALEGILSSQMDKPLEQNVLNEITLVFREIARRSARLVGATFAGVLLHNDPKLENKHTIAIDGSLYEKMPFYAEQILEAIFEIMPIANEKVKTVLSKDGSGAGAAIAAAAVSGAGK